MAKHAWTYRELRRALGWRKKGMTADEIAELLGRSTAAVQKRLRMHEEEQPIAVLKHRRPLVERPVEDEAPFARALEPLLIAPPADFRRQLRVPSQRRYVALYWEPDGHSLAIDDGVHAGKGFLHEPAWIEWQAQPKVHARLWLIEMDHGLQLGGPHEAATAWLVHDAAQNAWWLVDRESARRWVERQQPPERFPTALAQHREAS